ncbi:PDZ domain-containing protein [Maioricimonas rarisocia]|nr:PDZ domain-containing protein [Maioricimonas rarisocia]
MNRYRAASVAALLFVLTLPSQSSAQVDALEQEAFQQATALAGPSIVRIETIGGRDVVGELITGTGPTTGVIVGSDGYVITSSFNFIAQPAQILVTLPDDRRFTAEVVARDTSRMLTLLKIDVDGLEPLQATPRDKLQVGQWSLALGRTYSNTFPNLSVGIISALGRIDGKAIQTDAKVSPANYGGPLVDIEGRGMGILVPLSPQKSDETAGVEWYDSGIGFAVPLEDIYAVLPRLKAGEDLSPGLMGVTFEDTGPLAGEAKIEQVRPLSPADEAGLKPGDVIVEVNDQSVDRIPRLKQVLGARYAGDTLNVAVRRDEEVVRTEVTLVAELSAYEPAFLGILPTRLPLEAEATGIEIRHVYADSPAATAGLQKRDIITAVDDTPVSTPEELLAEVSRKLPAASVTITWQRGETEQSAEVTLGTVPNELPEQLPAASIPAPDEEAERPEQGHLSRQLAGDERRYWAYVPDQLNLDYDYGLLVWLHPAGDTMESDVLQQWRAICERRGIILVGPKAGDISGWTPDDAGFVKAVIEEMRQTYPIDPARIAVHGFAEGGGFAHFVGFRNRELIRGISTVAAPIRIPPPTNTPEYRLQFHFISGEEDALAEAIEETVEGLRKMGYPTSAITLPETGRVYPDASTIEALAGWLDQLDRI